MAVTGEFTEWAGSPLPMTQIGDSGIFHASREFPNPVRVEYKLVVDGKWIEDPFCPNQVDNGVGGRNSYFVVGDFAEPAELEERRGVAKGRVEEFDFTSKLLANTRRVYVYLPPNYQRNAKQRFALLLVHDGGEYLNRAKLGVVLDNLGASGDIPRLIAVMVDPVDRTREYRADEDYARFVEQELLPHIDRTYRTLTDAGSRAVMGASLGGLISVYLGLTRPQLFSKVGRPVQRADGGKRASGRVGKQARDAVVVLLRRRRIRAVVHSRPPATGAAARSQGLPMLLPGGSRRT